MKARDWRLDGYSGRTDTQPDDLAAAVRDLSVPIHRNGHITAAALCVDMQTDGNLVIYDGGHVESWASMNGPAVRGRNNIAEVKDVGRRMMREAGWVDTQWPCL